ncbi:MAG TPA: acyl carrier protein [Kofleriaceae bacterium]|nr:acyl carrier protein [Kofleriaceae bacterium]
MPNSISSRTKSIVSATLGVPLATLTDESGPATISNWDSLHHLHLIVALEAEFGVSFDPEEALELTSVAMFVAAIQQLGGK